MTSNHIIIFCFTNVVGEISAPMPSNYKIPFKTSSTDNDPINQLNLMEYFSTAPTPDQSSPEKPATVAKKRKRDNGAPHLFYSSESLRCNSTMTVDKLSMFQDHLAMNHYPQN